MQHAYSMPAGTFSPTSLKRARSGDFPQPSTELPRLPEINADLILEVYTHESVCPPNAKPGDFADNRRLSKLGESILKTTVTMALFKKQPLISSDEIEEQRGLILNNNVIQGWVKSYQMASRILCTAEYQPKRDTPEACREVFCAYVGAVFRHSGQEVVGKWVELLVKYYEQQGATTPRSAETPPAKKIKNEPTSPLISLSALSPTTSSTASTGSTSTDTRSPTPQVYSPTSPYLNAPQQQQYPSTYPTHQVPPHMSRSPYPVQMATSAVSANTVAMQPQQLSALFQSLTKLSQSPALRAVTANQSQRAQSATTDGKATYGQGIAPLSGSQQCRPNPLAPATPNAPFLPMFNQSANQRGVKVDYSAEFEGPAHAGQWLVECLVNGIPKGKGKGSSKQIAKEEAARQAYYSMGWT